jgi:hypothetical protein
MSGVTVPPWRSRDYLASGKVGNRSIASFSLRRSEPPLRVESRCGAVAVGCTYLLPPLSIGGALVVQPWLRFHIPLIEPDKQISRIRLSDKTSRFAFACDAELRSLPSTGITRLHWYYEPLRHPRAPGLSLAGVRLVIGSKV